MMGILSDEIGQAVMNVTESGIRRIQEKEGPTSHQELLEFLFEASQSGNYTEVAEYLARGFWEIQELVGVGTSVAEYRQLFAVLVEKCPDLREPLQQALEVQNPYSQLVPDAPAPANEDVAPASADAQSPITIPVLVRAPSGH